MDALVYLLAIIFKNNIWIFLIKIYLILLSDHDFYVAKVVLKQILVLDFFGGVKTVTPEEYFAAEISRIINLDSYFKGAKIVAVAGSL